MGLDNFPTTYPCHKAGTAIERTVVSEDPDGTSYQQIDCDATIAAHGCPWAVAAEGRGTSITGMFGTPCWYRGKAGTWMLERLGKAGHHLPDDIAGGFYGPDGVDDMHLPQDYCRRLGHWMATHVEAYAKATADDGGDVAVEVDEYRYAAWWLTWVATAGDGAQAWW